MNLIIGKNNSGKSNLYKLFQLIHRASGIDSVDPTRGWNYSQFINFGKTEFGESDFWDADRKTIEVEVTLYDSRKVIHLPSDQSGKAAALNLHQQNGANGQLTLKAQIDVNDVMPGRSEIPGGGISLLTTTTDSEPIIEVLSPTSCRFNESLVGNKKNESLRTQYEGAAFGYPFLFLSALEFIDPVRDLRKQSGMKQSRFDGEGHISALLKFQDDKSKVRQWRKFKRQIEKWMSEILDEPIFELERVGGEIRFVMRRSTEKERVQYLEQLGTGVAQCFMILTYLLMKKEENLIVFLEEPENNLHPGSAMKLINILEGKDFENHQFFITSHSSAVMDQINEKWTVHRTVMSTLEGTKLERCDEMVKMHLLFDDLGYRASQLLQTNLVIWVEGPSDRIYINAWIRSATKGALKEGKHYSFLFFGGSNLKYVGVLDDNSNADSLIDVFKTSRYSVIVTDSDKDRMDAPGNSWIVEVRAQLDQDPEAKRFIKLWETDGREIENYVPFELWQKVPKQKKLVKNFFRGEEKGHQIKCELIGENIRKLDPFDDFALNLAESYRIGESEKEPSSDYVGRLKHYHDGKKVALAHYFSANWKLIHFKNNLNLADRIISLIDNIITSNGLYDKDYFSNDQRKELLSD